MRRPAAGQGGALRAPRSASAPKAKARARGGRPAGRPAQRPGRGRTLALPDPGTHRDGRPRLPLVAPGRQRARRRYAVAYDLDGPRVRLGLGWFALIMGALLVTRQVAGFPVLAVVFAAAAALAAGEVVDAWQGQAVGADRHLAMGGAAAIGMAAVFGVRLTGLAILLVVVAAVVSALTRIDRPQQLLAGSGLVVQASVIPGLVAASVVLSLRYEIGAVLLLLFLVSAFDVGDFLVGSGADSVIEGPLAGGLAMLVVVAIVAVLKTPPFHGSAAWGYGAVAIVACPVGQLVASALLPDARYRASALRRLDSLLVLAPLWAWLVGLYTA